MEFACREFRLKLDKFTLLQQNHFADLKKAIEARRDYLYLKIEGIAKDMLKQVDTLNEEFKRAYNDKQFDTISDTFNVNYETQNVSDSFRDLTNLEASLTKRADAHTRKLKEIKVKLELFGETQEDLLSYRFDAKFNFNQECFGFIRSGNSALISDDDDSDHNLIACFNEENENEIKLWDLKSNTVCMRLSGHTGRLNACCIYKHIKLISGGNDSLIKIWSLKSGECLSTLSGHTNTVRSLKVIKGDMLVSGYIFAVAFKDYIVFGSRN